LYLRAEYGHLPELKRVIAAYGERVVMKETLSDALSALFTAPVTAPVAATEMPRSGTAQEALDRYNQAMERLKSGDWAGFGAQMEAIRGVLEKLSRESSGTKSPAQ
jgi:uncharacterized membrane protein (UPF0182 family)